MNGPEGVVDAARGLERGRPRRHPCQRRRPAAGRRARRAARGREGQRLRPRRGPGGPGRARRGRLLVGRRPRRGGRAAPRGGHRRADHAPVGARATRVAARVVAAELVPVVYTEAGIDALAKAVADSGRGTPLEVHLKVDTGMHRVGCAPDDALALARAIAGARRAVRSRACAPTWPSPTSPTTPTRPNSWRGSTRCSTSSTPS